MLSATVLRRSHHGRHHLVRHHHRQGGSRHEPPPAVILRAFSAVAPSSSSSDNNNNNNNNNNTPVEHDEKNYNMRMLKLLAKNLWPDGRTVEHSFELKSRVVASVGLMVASKLITIQVPFIFKDIIDSLSTVAGPAGEQTAGIAGSTVSSSSSSSSSSPSSASSSSSFASLDSTADAVTGSGGGIAEAADLAVASLSSSSVEGVTEGASAILEVAGAEPALAVPVAMMFGYGIARTTAAACQELRSTIFSTVAQRAIRQVSGDVFDNLQARELQFHLDRKLVSYFIQK